MRSSVSDKAADRKNGSAFAQQFVDTLHRKLHDPTLLQAYPPPAPDIFKHTDKHVPPAAGSFLAEAAADLWGSEKHPFGAPSGSYKLLSSDYAWLDAPRLPNRRDANTAAGVGALRPDGSDGEHPAEPPLPEPPLAMQHNRFLAHARLVLVKLRRQLEEICVGAVRGMEAAALPPGLAGDTASSSMLTRTSPSASVTAVGAALAHSRGVGPGGGVDGGGGGGRLPPGLADEVTENVRSKLSAAFEDSLADLMDQLWGALQYAGSKHAIVERLAEAMRQREAELEATAARYREEAASKLRALRRQKEEIEAAAEKDRVEMRALAAAANSRVDFLERELSGVRAALEAEKATTQAKLDAQRAEYEVALAAKDEALEALRADGVARLEELRVACAAAQQQLQQRTEEVARLAARTTDQSDILALALARRDGTSRELDVLQTQLDDYKRFMQLCAPKPLPDWLRTLREGDVPLTPLIGGPLALEFGTGRAFMAAARSEGLHAVQEELRRLLPPELPWPEDGWPPEGGEDGMYEDGEKGAGRMRSPSPGFDMNGGSPAPPTLPATWLRFVRAPLGHVLEPWQLLTRLADLARAKWEADREARLQGQAPPDLHMFVYKHALNEHSSSLDADESVTCLVQSLRAHAAKLPRAATWMQLLQLSSPVLPLDACGYYLEVFHALVSPTHSHASKSSRSSQQPNVVDKAGCTVWVPPTRWKPLLTGPTGGVFDAERKMTLLRQAAAVRVDTTRGSKTFGMADGDAMMAVVMGVWLGQRQAAINDLTAAWTSLEPVGGGVLAVNMDVNQLAGVAVTALGRDAIPQDRPSQLDLYFATVQAARKAQAAARMRWSGLNVAALTSALSAAELLPPRPLTRRGSPSAARLAAASGLLLRLAEFAAEEMRGGQGAFRQHPSFGELETAIGRLQDMMALCGRDASVREQAEQEKRLQAGWGVLDEVTGVLLAAQDAFRGFEAAAREQAVRAAVEAAMAQRRSGTDEGSEGRRPGSTPRLASMRSRSSRNHRAPTLSNTGDPAVTPGDPGATTPPSSAPPSHRLSGSGAGGSGHGALAAMVGRTSLRFHTPPGGSGGGARPLSGLGRPVSGRPPSAAWPRDLRAALASGRWSSDEEEEVVVVSADGGVAMTASPGTTPPTLQLRSRTSSRKLLSSTVPGELSPLFDAVASAAGAANGTRSATTAGFTTAAGTSPPPSAKPTAAATAMPAATALPPTAVAVISPQVRTGAAEEYSHDDLDLDPNLPAEARLAQLEEKYGKLRSRFGETVRAVSAAYNVAAASTGDTGSGLPAAEVMAQLGPAAKLRLVAELLAELHQEVEQGVWPHLDTTVLAAIGGSGVEPSVSGGGLSSRPSSSRPTSALPPGRMTVHTISAIATPRSSTLTPTAGAGVAAGGGEAAGAMAASEAGTTTPPAAAGRMGSELSGQSSYLGLGPGLVFGGYGGVSTPGELSPADAATVAAASGVAAVAESPLVGGVPLAEVQEVAGRLHAHAGHVGQVMAAAALETAALAAALEDLSGWRSRNSSIGPRPATAVVLTRSPGTPGTTSGESARLGVGNVGLSPIGSFRHMDGGLYTGPVSWRTPDTTTGSSIVVGSPEALWSPLSPGPSPGLSPGVLRPTSSTQRRSLGLVPPLPLAALQFFSAGRPGSASMTGSGGLSSRRGSATSADGRNSARCNGGDGSSSGGPDEEENMAEEVATDPWDALPHDADPRDTVYLDALRSLHLAAQAQAQAQVPGAEGGGDVSALAAAVREVVRLLGGQPQVTEEGEVVEFYPRRIPKDWRSAVLRSSLTRLYIFICGALLQQHERAALLREASADLDQRTVRLTRAAQDLEAKAAGLQGLQSCLGAQLAAMAGWMTHGSVLMERLGKLEALGGELKGRVVGVKAGPAPGLVGGNPGQLSRPEPVRSCPPGPVGGAAAPAPAVAGGVGSLPRPGPVKGRLSGLSWLSAAAELAPAAIAAAAAAATDGVVVTSSTSSSAMGPAAGGKVSAPAKPPSRVIVFTLEEWETVQGMAEGLAAAVAGLRTAAQQLAGLAESSVGAQKLLENTTGTTGIATPSCVGKAPLTAPLLPSGDHILSVHVHMAPPPHAAAAGGKRPADDKPQGLLDGGSGEPCTEEQQQPEAMTFVISLPLPSGAAAAPSGNAAASTMDTRRQGKPSTDSDPGASCAAEVDDDGMSSVSGSRDVSPQRRPGADSTPAGTAAGGDARGLPQYPDVGTPAVTPEASCSAPPLAPSRTPRAPAGAATGFTLRMTLRQLHGASGGAGSSTLPPGEELIRLSGSLLRRSAMAAMRRHMGSNGGARPMGRSVPGGPQTADGLGPVPPHYERRPMTARAFVEGVMIQAREEQLERLYGAAGPMPRGGLPEVEGLARIDAHEAALLEQQQQQRAARAALVLAGPGPHPTTALETLVQQNREQAAAASAAANTAVAEAVSAAAAAAAAATGVGMGTSTPRTPGGRKGHPQQQRPRALGSKLGGAGPGPATAAAVIAPGTAVAPGRVLARRPSSVHHSRLVSGVQGTKVSTLPPMGQPTATSSTSLADAPSSWPLGAHLGYYPGVQVDAVGHVADWRLPVLASFPAPSPLQRTASLADRAPSPQRQ